MADHDKLWTEVLAVGDEAFTGKEEHRGLSKPIRTREESGEGFDLREAASPYEHAANFAQGPLTIAFDENPG